LGVTPKTATKTNESGCPESTPCNKSGDESPIDIFTAVMWVCEAAEAQARENTA